MLATMKFHGLCESLQRLPFPAVGERVHPDEQTIRNARAAVIDAVVDDEFLADCISYELQLIELNRLRRGLVPFFTLPDLGIRFSFGYWAPGATPGPHEHTAWTVTAVCRNELDVLTFDRTESYRCRKLVPKNLFQAHAGMVGFIYAPCIHAPKNTSQDWSLSFHVTSPLDGEPLPDQTESLPELRFPTQFSPSHEQHPYSHVMRARQRANHVRQLARILTVMEVSQAPHLLTKCYDLASSSTRRMLNRIAPCIGQRDVSRSPWLLARTHAKLVLSHRDEHNMVTLYADAPQSLEAEFTINNFAREAIEFAARQTLFDIREFPGELSDEERLVIAEALEDTGLFARVWQ